MYILKILVYPLEIYIIENRFFKTQNSLNPVYMNTSFAIKKVYFSFITVRIHAKN